MKPQVCWHNQISNIIGQGKVKKKKTKKDIEIFLLFMLCVTMQTYILFISREREDKIPKIVQH